jgi:hypothetical protein
VNEPTGTPMALVVAVRDDGTETVLGRVVEHKLDLALVDALLRLELAARRRGWHVCVRAPSDELRGLLDLVGVSEVLRVEPRRQSELREQLGVQEVVQPGDASV